MKKILLLFGGKSPEHFISCKSARFVLENVDKDKYIMDAVGISRDGEWFLFDADLDYLESGNWLEVSKNRPILNPVFFIHQYDLVFPITHGVFGEDGKLQGFLDLFLVKYVGFNTTSSAISMDKVITKKIMDYHKIPQVSWMSLKKGENIDKLLPLEFPIIVKPSNGGSSIGISKVNSLGELSNALDNAFLFDDEVVVEKFGKFRELEVGILDSGEVLVSPVGEIITPSSFYDFDAKYKNNDALTIIPASIPASTYELIRKYALDIFKILNGKGFARVDFFYDEENDLVYFNEINTLPGFTEISMYPKLFLEYGISNRDLISALIEKEIG